MTNWAAGAASGGGDDFSSRPWGAAWPTGAGQYARTVADSGEDPGQDPMMRGAQAWYGGRNLTGTESGWDSDWQRRAWGQYSEQVDKSRKSGNPGDYYNWFQRPDATGVALWKDDSRLINANGQQRGLRVGDTFDNGTFVGNLYDQHSKKDADLLLGEFVFDGDQKARLFEREKKTPGAYSRELTMATDDHTRRAQFGQQAWETQEAVKDKAEEWSDGWKDTAAAGFTGLVGGVAAGGLVAGPWGMLVGGLGGLVTGILNQDQFTETVARAQVQADQANKRGMNGAEAGAWLSGIGGALNFAASPIQNAVAGAYEWGPGYVGDGVSDFNKIDPGTGEREASGWWQGAHLASAVGDSFLTFGSKPALALYQTSLAFSIGGKTAQMPDRVVWSDEEGGWHKLEDKGEWGGALVAVGIDGLQMGVSSWAGRAAAEVRKVATGSTTLANGRRATFQEEPADIVSRAADAAWRGTRGKLLGGRTVAGHTFRDAKPAAAVEGAKAPEVLSGQKFFFDAAGNPIASRATAVAMVPSEGIRYITSKAAARYRTIRQGGEPGMVSQEDLYQAALKMSGNGGRMADAMLNALAEGSEEMVQRFAEVEAYSGDHDAQDILRAGAYGAAAGFGMGIGPMLNRAGTDASMRANGYLLELARTGDESLTREQWDERWKTFSPVERRKYSTGNRAEVAKVQEIVKLMGQRRQYEMTGLGWLPTAAMAPIREEAQKADLAGANRLPEGARQMHILPIEMFATDADKRHAAKGNLYERPVWPANASGHSAYSLAREFRIKRDALQQFVKTNPTDPQAPAVKAELEVVQKILGWMNKQRDVLAKRPKDDAGGREAQVRYINATLQKAAQDGVWNENGTALQVPADVIRNAASIHLIRHPIIEGGSVFTTVPQVHLLWTINNIHGAVGLPVAMQEAAQGDFDGDNAVFLHQAIFKEGQHVTMESGARYLAPKDGYDEDGNMVGRTWVIKMGRPKDEASAINKMFIARDFRTALSSNDVADKAINEALIILGKKLHKRYAGLLKTAPGHLDPLSEYFTTFRTELLSGNTDAVLNFMQSFVDHQGGRGGIDLVDMGREKHRAEVLEMNNLFTVALENILRTYRSMDHATIVATRAVTKQNRDPIPEVNRKYIGDVAIKDAATTGQMLAAIHGFEGARAAAHVNYSPWLQYAIDLTLAAPDSHLQEIEIRLAEEFQLLAASGATTSKEQEVEDRNITTARVRDWVDNLAAAIGQKISERATNPHALSDMQAAFLVAGLRSADLDEQKDGTYKTRARGDISFAQLMLRASVQIDKNRYKDAAPDDPIHAKLNRLNSYTTRNGERSITSYIALKEVFGDMRISELIGEDAARFVGPDATMNQLLQMFMVMGKDETATQFRAWKNELYQHGSKKDPPWALETVTEQGFNAYTLLIDTMQAIANSQHSLLEGRAETLGKQTRGGLDGLRDLVNSLIADSSPQIREFFGMGKNAKVEYDHALEYALSIPLLAEEMVNLFPEKSRNSTFKILPGGRVVTAKWVREALKEKAEKAELMFIVESAFDLLRAQGGVIDREPDPNDPDAVAAKAVPFEEKLESRLARMMNRLAGMGSNYEINRFLEVYKNSQSVKGFYAKINSEPLWVGNEPQLIPYYDSKKDFETDPYDMWSAGTMNTQRFEKLTGFSDRIAGLSKKLRSGLAVEATDAALVSKLKKIHEAAKAGKVADDEARKKESFYHMLEATIAYSQKIATMHGPKTSAQVTAVLQEEMLSLANKGASDERVRAIGDAYILATGMNMQPGIMQEFEIATSHTLAAVTQNPDLLTRGPVTIQMPEGVYVDMDLTTMEGVLEQLEIPGMKALVYAAILPSHRDLDGQGNLRLYHPFDPTASLQDILTELAEPPIEDVDRLSPAEADKVIGIFSGFARRAGENMNTPESIRDSAFVVDSMLMNVATAYTTRPDWKRLSPSQKEQLNTRGRIKVAMSLLKLAQVEGAQNHEQFGMLLEAAVVDRWSLSEGGPLGQVDEVFRDIFGDPDVGAADWGVLAGVQVEVFRKEILQLRERQDQLRSLEAELDEARRWNNTNDIARISTQINGYQTEIEYVQQIEALDKKIESLSFSRQPSGQRGLHMFKMAFNSYYAAPHDPTPQARAARSRVVTMLLGMGNDQRLAAGKNNPLIKNLLAVYTADPEGLIAGKHFPEESTWRKFAVIAAKQYIADRAGPSGANMLFATTPGETEADGLHYWDESFSYIARPLFNPYILQAAKWFKDTYQLPTIPSAEAVDWMMTGGLFALKDYGAWNPLMAGQTMNAQKALEGASTTLAVPIGGNLPKTAFDASVSSYSVWDAPVLPEHESSMKISGQVDDPRNSQFSSWTGVDAATGKNQSPLEKLHHHFGKDIDFSQITRQVEDAFKDKDRVAAIMEERFAGLEPAKRQTEVALKVAELFRDPAALADEVAQAVADVERRMYSSLQEPVDVANDQGYLLIDLAQMQHELTELGRRYGFTNFEVGLTYVDISKKPFTDEYRNHGLFDGVGRRAEIEGAISPFGAMMFGVDGLSKLLQQTIFDYVARGGSSYTPYIPTRAIKYRDLEKNATSVEELMLAKTRQIMSRTYETGSESEKRSGKLLHDDFPAVYKLVKSRHIYKGADPAGRVRYMWAEEVIAYENTTDPAVWSSGKLEMMPLNEEIFRLLVGASTLQAGGVITRPEYDIDKIDKNPSLDLERLISLGLEDMGAHVGAGRTVLSTGILLPKAHSIGPKDTGALRTSMDERVAKWMRNARETSLWRGERDRKGKGYDLARINATQRRKTLDDLDERETQIIFDTVGLPSFGMPVAGMETAQKLASSAGKGLPPGAQWFHYAHGRRGNWLLGTLGNEDITGEAQKGDPTWGDLVTIDLASILHDLGNDEDAAFKEAQAAINWFADLGVTIILVSKMEMHFRSRVSKWMQTNSLSYTPVQGSPYMFEPETRDNTASPTEDTINSSLTEFSTFAPRNAHVVAHFTDMGFQVDENAGMLLDPTALGVPVRRQVALVPAAVTSAKFGKKPGEFIFNIPDDTSPRKQQMILDALNYLTPEGILELKRMAATSGTKEAPKVRTRRVNGQSVFDPEPTGIDLYKVFDGPDQSGNTHPGIRNFDDAMDILIDTLNAGKLPMYVGESGRMAGDFILGLDIKGRMLFQRIGFTEPFDISALFDDGVMFGIGRPKMEPSVVIPPGFEIVKIDPDSRGLAVDIEVPMSVWAKLAEQGEGVRNTVNPLLQEYELPGPLGQNGASITYATSNRAQVDKMGRRIPGEGFSGVFAMVGADLRIHLVNTLLGKQHDSTDSRDFVSDWDALLPVLHMWQNNDFGLTDSDIRDKLSSNTLFDDININLERTLSAAFSQFSGVSLNPLAIPALKRGSDIGPDTVSVDITRIFLSALAASSVKVEHIASTPGIWSVSDRYSETAISVMQHLFTDALGDMFLYPHIRNQLLDEANARIERFTADDPGNPPIGQPRGYWDNNFVFHYWMYNKNREEWAPHEAFLSVGFPVVATQNPTFSMNAAVSSQQGGFTPHVAAVLGLATGARMITDKDTSRRVDALFGDNKQSDFEKDPLQDMRAVLRGAREGYISTDVWGGITSQEQSAQRRVRTAIGEYDFAINKSKKKWRDSLTDIAAMEDRIIDLTGLDNSHGFVTSQLDMMVRMFYGLPGPIGLDQKDWKEQVAPDSYLEALTHFVRMLEKHRDPMFGGALPISPPRFMMAVKNAGKWAPVASESKDTSVLASSWEDWVKSLWGQLLESPFGIDGMFMEGMDGLLQIWKEQSKTLEGMGLSLDMIRNILPKNRQVNETLSSLDLLTEYGRRDPLVIDAWDQVDATLSGKRTPESVFALREAHYTQAHRHNARRRQWMAEKKMPKPLNKKMKIKDYLSDGAYYLDNKTKEHAFFNGLTNLSHMTRLADPLIFASGYVEQPWRMLYEHTTDLLTGRYVGPGAERAARRLESEKVKKVTGSKFVQETLGFSDFKQTFTSQDHATIKMLARTLGSDSRFLEKLHKEAQYANLVQEGQGWIGKKLEKGAAFTARTFSDPLYGASQEAVAMRYITGAIEDMHATGQQVSIPALARELMLNPNWLSEQYGDVGLNPDKAGMNRVLQIRSQKMVPATRAIRGSIDYLTSSPNRFSRIAGWMLNIPFAYTRFNMNALQFITGMDGWSQAGATFFSGRKRPKWLGGGTNGRSEYWDMTDLMETMDLRRTFIRSGTTLTMLFTMGMLAGAKFGFAGEDEEERRRRRAVEYLGLVEVKDPSAPENDFRNADAIFLDSIPVLGNLFDDGKGSTSIVPHWIFRQFTSPIIGFSRFFQTGDPREIGYGFLDAFAAIPNSVKRIWDEADMTAKMLFDEAEASASDPSSTGQARTMGLFMQAVSVYEKALFENSFVNSLYVGKDRYDRDPWAKPGTDELNNILFENGLPVPTKDLESYVDPKTGEVKQGYAGREGMEGQIYSYAENNAMFAAAMSLVTGFTDSPFLRQNMVPRMREIQLEDTPMAKAEAAIYALYMQGGGLESLTEEEIGYKLKDDYDKADIWWNEDDIRAEAATIHESRDQTMGALSFLSPEGAELVTPYGGDRIIDGLVKGTIKLGSPELIGVSMDQDMRDAIGVNIQKRLVQDGIDMGLPQKTAEYRAKRFYYGEDDRPDVPGIREILYSDDIPSSNLVKYNQLNVMYMVGPDGKMWATPYERKTMMQAILPLPHNMVSTGSGTTRTSHIDPITGEVVWGPSIVDEVLGINTGLAGIERVIEPGDDIKPNDELMEEARKTPDNTDSETPARNRKPWKSYPRGGGGGGGGFTPQMRALPGGTAVRFDGIQMINTSNPILRRADVYRQRIWSDRGRLKQWQ